MNLSFAYTHSPIEFYFRQSPRDFVVEEVPLYPFNGDGMHLVLKIRKKNLTTFELLKILSNHLGIKEKDIGYAGLKDKNALTIQHISLPYFIKDKLENFIHPDIKILDSNLHHNKIKIGHLKGNKFFLRVKKLSPLNAQKIVQAVESIKKFGVPNYFSYQRFGADGRNYLQGREIVEKKRRLRDRKMHNFLISAYQSYLFNLWLSMRIDISHIIASYDIKEISKALELYLQTNDIPACFKESMFCNKIKSQKHPFKLLEGDMLCHYPYGKHFFLESMEKESLRFLQKDIAPTGLLSGKKAMFALGCAEFFEKKFLDSNILSIGQRRYAWVFPQDLEFFYKEQEAQGEFSFFLPKGAYATNLLREIAHREIKEEE
ncbi:tRNA pseudouridine(13) synthase TruD [Helicobacter winghamensis]|uniref:tRNA pseudouridine synthase D n=1 Tax=Helicobacter winghamensis TaxID=157268 RepID=A0A2N3PL40_9HELI|nr:tRNA pseudouridine(13) synthase TruD [Helicobacter winghamensis]EEO26632.1 tRNA pseudouridine synthase D [Helicobacter winghamensis ATCC BAA-430]PKT79236.1 tRNA pseudouridine(13) synthase TruD [Helicobacter winghamensis]PKT79318.1 tRNA pseudouridine(13) synthase TruD [Helicobacter winghamensis]PKT79440.1 tRNA pseudouridine(13) synthase TruD [Helicobacter winghamensis]PKT82409.1 tRNA pseudouridine(13) synthase TruD [Helicobacter winghamensis]